MKKLLACMLAVCMTLTVLAGCSSPSSSSGAPAVSGAGNSAPATSGTDKEIVMDMIWWTDGNETVVMQELIDEYHELHPNITINLQEIAFSDLDTKLQMAIAGGEAPALSRGTESTVSRMHEAMVDFADYTDVEALKSEYLESVDYLYKSGDTVVAVPT